MAIVRVHDVRDAGRHNLPLCDVLVGGFPCQDLSVAGKRAGLRGERSGLFFEFVRLASELRSTWLVIENVPGLLSSNEGRDMGAVIEGLEDAGYSCAWRVLDSQWFGVAQRRRRVFIVGHARPECAGAVLFEPEGRHRYSATVRQAGQDIAGPLTCCPPGARQRCDASDNTHYIIDTFNQSTSTSTSTTLSQGESGRPLLAYALNAHGGSHGRIDGDSETFVSAPPDPERVRETPGLPRGLDSRRYKQLGNAVTVPVIEWIGRRILMVERLVGAGLKENG